MKTLFIHFVVLGLLSLPLAFGQAAGTVKGSPGVAAQKTGGCVKCGAASTSQQKAPEAAKKTIPGSDETIVVGRIENVIPIGVLTVLGCEKCSAKAVNWALQQGSSFDDVERTLQTIGAMQTLDCFKGQFGPEVATRMEKPLAAAREALAEARARAAQ